MALVALLAADAGAQSRTMQSLPADVIGNAVQRELSARLAQAGRSATVTVIGRVADQPLPAGRARIVVGEIGGVWPRERLGVPVQLWVDERAMRNLTVWVELKDERTVLTYAADYRAGQGSDGMTMTPARINMACCADPTVASSAEVAALRTRRTVHAGAPVLLSDFEPVPEVIAQQRVTVEVMQGPVHLSTLGVAMTDGRIGERIAVRIQPQQALVRCRVVAKEKVRVDE